VFNKASVIIFLGTFVELLGIVGVVGRGGVISAKAEVATSEPNTGLSSSRFQKLNEPSFTGLLKPVFLAPTSLQIAKLNLDKPIEELGVVGGRIGVPSDWQGVGYYVGSSRAGEAGNIIIVGHLDDNYGRPGAFYNIGRLAVNDVITIGDGHRVFNYRVTGKASILDGTSEALQEDLGGPGLILVTCGGTWNYTTHSYSQRLLVKAVLSK